MKRTFIAAATLLLGTSALSGLSNAAEAVDSKDKGATAKLQAAGEPAADAVIAMKYAAAAAIKNGTAPAMGGPLEDDSDMSGKYVEQDPIVLAKYEQAAAMKSSTGMGGPLEEANAGTVSLTPRPATDNYPPCNPGPGDDRCIQLYEPGVRAQLASWNQTSGGLADNSVTTAMGGPYEPLDGSTDDTEHAMNGDGILDSGLGETSDGDVNDVELAQHSQFSGVGGPIESQSGYPPCSPGPGDDRCIQLYERGVTGAGN